MRLSRTITAKNRAELIRAVEAAPLGAQFEIVDAPRTLAQNKLMWRLLSHISEQVLHCGEFYEPDDWRAAFLKAQGAKLRFMPAIDGEGVVCVGYRSSKLDKEKFSELIEHIYQFGAEHGVDFDAELGVARRGLAMRGEAMHGVAQHGGATQGSARQGEEM